MKRLRWYLTDSDGVYDRSKPVMLELPEHDYDCLRDLWGQLERTPRTNERWRPLFNELRTLLDLYASFPGGALVVERPRPQPVPPAYLRRLDEDQTELFENGEPSVAATADGV